MANPNVRMVRASILFDAFSTFCGITPIVRESCKISGGNAPQAPIHACGARV
jgi:hypothetical protein